METKNVELQIVYMILCIYHIGTRKKYIILRSSKYNKLWVNLMDAII